ncbi:MAG TPA: T9SS type A sorting domain-containing protein [Candidatus Kapabacteria bacterium]
MRGITFILLLLFLVSGLAKAQHNYFDESFGDHGVEITITPQSTYGYDCILLPDGKMLQAVMLDGGDSKGAVIYRREYNGKIDSSFGRDGRMSFRCDGNMFDLRLATYPDGRILFHGAEFYGSLGYISFIYRLLPSGIIDSTFGTDGRQYISDSTMSQIATLTIGADEKIVVAGEEGSYVNQHAMTQPVLWSLTSNGKRDSTFGINGKISIPIDLDSIMIVTACKDSNNGFIFFYNKVFQDYNSIYIFRAYEDGSIDTTYGSGGLMSLRLTDSPSEIPMAMTLPDGSVVFAMNFGNKNSRTVLVKLVKDGELDPTFGNGGTVEIVAGTGGVSSSALVLDSSGRIITAGRVLVALNTSISSVFRILPDGVLDSTFGLNGTLQLIDETYGVALGIRIQPDGKYLISAYSWSNKLGQYGSMLARLNPDPKSSVLQNISRTSSISLYPTPSLDNCTITYTLPTNSDCSLTLRDESGRAVKTYMTSEYRSAGKHEDELDLRGLAAGVYFLSLGHNGKTETAKFIKQ